MLEHEGATLLVAEDLEWAGSQAYLLVLARELPVLKMFIDDSLAMIQRELEPSLIDPMSMDSLLHVTEETAAVASLAIRRALWRDLMPTAGPDALVTHKPLARGPWSPLPPAGESVAMYVYYWRAFGRTLRRHRRSGFSDPPTVELMLDGQQIWGAFELNRNPHCLDQFPLLVDYIGRGVQRARDELTRRGVNPYWVRQATHPVRLIPMVAATAVYLAVWGNLYADRPSIEPFDEPRLF